MSAGSCNLGSSPGPACLGKKPVSRNLTEAALGWPGFEKGGMVLMKSGGIWIFAGDNRRSEEHGPRNKKKASVSEGSSQEDRSCGRSLGAGTRAKGKAESDTRQTLRPPKDHVQREAAPHPRGWRNKGWEVWPKQRCEWSRGGDAVDAETCPKAEQRGDKSYVPIT